MHDLPKNWLTRIDSLRRCLPTAKKNNLKPDPQALHKLLDEYAEFIESGCADPTELADVVYYAAGAVIAELCSEQRAISWIVSACQALKHSEYPNGVTTKQAYRACLAKYRSRVDHGKDKRREALLVELALMEK